jgi:hypothetical protein
MVKCLEHGEKIVISSASITPAGVSMTALLLILGILTLYCLEPFLRSSGLEEPVLSKVIEDSSAPAEKTLSQLPAVFDKVPIGKVECDLIDPIVKMQKHLLEQDPFFLSTSLDTKVALINSFFG